MIKKINIALVSVFAMILLASALRGVLSGEKRKNPEARVESRSAASNAPKVNVYYVRWAKYAMKNKITCRNGVLLDIMRAIFPGAGAQHIVGEAKKFVEKMAEDPSAVVVGFGDHPDFAGCRRAPTPLAMAPLVVRTLRSNPWRYEGQESLDKLRLIVRSSLLDYSVIRERLKNGSDKTLVVESGMTIGEMMDLIESGKADGFVATGESGTGEMEMTAAQILLRFRTSEPISNDPVYLYVSSADPAFADAVIDAYEKGMRRIAASGELDRIFEYYDMTHDPIPDMPCDRAM